MLRLDGVLFQRARRRQATIRSWAPVRISEVHRESRRRRVCRLWGSSTPVRRPRRLRHLGLHTGTAPNDPPEDKPSKNSTNSPKSPACRRPRASEVFLLGSACVSGRDFASVGFNVSLPGVSVRVNEGREVSGGLVRLPGFVFRSCVRAGRPGRSCLVSFAGRV